MVVTIRVGDRIRGVGPGWLAWLQQAADEGDVEVRFSGSDDEVRLIVGRAASGALPDGLGSHWSALGLDRCGWEPGALARFVALIER